ncbi:MAG: pyrroloquinoline quinone biosynthesis protein PqqB [Xanthobacteraceae bacterium]
MGRLTAIVLGSAAGGGVPQWNCSCPVCRLAWEGDARVRPRTQSGLAVTADGHNWILINASPDLGQQIRRSKGLQPRSGVRGSPIKAVVLTGAEIDQIAGLLTLRERERVVIHASAAVLAILAENPIFNGLAPELVTRSIADSSVPVALPGGLQAELFPVPGKPPLYIENVQPTQGGLEETNAGVELCAGGTCLIYVPGAAAISPPVRERLARADVILFDGTFFRDDEMERQGTGTKTAFAMGHMPISGEGGSLAILQGIGARRIYVHINNTNPVLIHGTPERAEVEQHGWEIAEDGMEIAL